MTPRTLQRTMTSQRRGPAHKPKTYVEKLQELQPGTTLYPKNYAHGLRFVVFCFVLILANFAHILQGYFTGTGAIMLLPWWISSPYLFYILWNKFTTTKDDIHLIFFQWHPGANVPASLAAAVLIKIRTASLKRTSHSVMSPPGVWMLMYATYCETATLLQCQ